MSCPLVARSDPQEVFHIRGYQIHYGRTFQTVLLSNLFWQSVQASPISLATTLGISVDFCSWAGA